MMAASFDRLVQGGVALFAASVLLGVDCARLCTSEVGGESPEDKGARPPQKERPFLRVTHLGLHVYGGPGGGAFGLAGSFVPVSQPCLGPPPVFESMGSGCLNRDKGANTMAGTSMGAHAPAISPRPSAPLGASPTGPRGHASTRTRHVHSVLMLGDGDATVTSSRRQGEPRAVSITVRQGSILLTGHLTAPQAQALADALAKASKAAVAVAKARQWADTAMGVVVEGGAA